MKILFFLLSCGFFLPSSLWAQQSKTSEAQNTKQLLDSKQYIFKARSVTPNRGGYWPLGAEYDMRLFNDSLITYLPFFGRAYRAPLGSTDGGFNFTSTDFTYDIKDRKKGWDITLSPKDNSEMQQLLLSVSSSGNATLQIISTSREPISFRGDIVPRRK